MSAHQKQRTREIFGGARFRAVRIPAFADVPGTDRETVGYLRVRHLVNWFAFWPLPRNRRCRVTNLRNNFVPSWLGNDPTWCGWPPLDGCHRSDRTLRSPLH